MSAIEPGSFRSPLHRAFFDHAGSHPLKPALVLSTRTYSYSDLATLALRATSSIHNRIDPLEPRGRWIGVLCGKTLFGYAAILGVLNAGYGYMPILPNTPTDRALDYVTRSGCRMILVDREGLRLATLLLEKHLSRIHVILVDASLEDSIEKLRTRFPDHHFGIVDDEISAPDLRPVPQTQIAYLMFTSGSTGRPKGVVVSHGNVRHFLDVAIAYYDFGRDDRFSQFFEFTFDLSVFDMFVCYEVGATLYPLSDTDKMFAAKFIDRSGITVWFSVPSFISLMQKTRQLASNRFGNLRYSLFCGEALVMGAALKWKEAAPNSKVENLYGPTEVTISCTRYRLSSYADAAESDKAAIVPIGEIHDGLTSAVINEAGNVAGPGESGELLVAGPQVSLGYLDDPSEQSDRFVQLGSGNVFYRTGDIVQVDNNEPHKLHFLGRNDQQIKVDGYRVEIGEIEAAMRRMMPDHRSVVVAIGAHTGNTELCAIIEDHERLSGLSISKFRAVLEAVLPSYMIPKSMTIVSNLPENSNGKIDRKALKELILEQGSTSV